AGKWLSWRGSHVGGDDCSDDRGGGFHGGCGGVVLGCKGIGGGQCQLGMVMVAVVVWRCWWSRCGWWQWGSGDIVDRIDRMVGILFGFTGKSPPENFFGGGGVVADWPAAAAGFGGERE
nr:hypothetical protein [Tanacetum cinerariifolium]